MSAINGGCAFPFSPASSGYDHLYESGMTLLDYFAAEAMKSKHLLFVDGDIAKPSMTLDEACDAAYVAGAAMLRARQRALNFDHYKKSLGAES